MLAPTHPADPYGTHRVLDAHPALPQAAHRLDDRPELWPDEVRIRVDRLNLDAASYRQLVHSHSVDGVLDRRALRQQVLDIVAARGKLQNPVTGSGGMLTGTVEEVGPASDLGLRVGDRVATLVSLSLTPLRLTDRLERWDGDSEQVPTAGHAVLFGRSIVAVLPEDIPAPLALAVLDVCGAPALTARVAQRYQAPRVLVIGAGGKSGSLALAAARRAGAAQLIGVVPHRAEAQALDRSGLADEIVLADARDPVALRAAVAAVGGPVEVTVVCVDVPGCEGGAVLATGDGGTIVFFSMTTSFTAAALGAEGAAADVTMLIGNGYVPGHAELALDLVRTDPGVRAMVEARLR